MSTTRTPAEINGCFHQASALDFVPRPHLRDLQSQRLRRVVRRTYDRVAHYRQRMQDEGLRPEDIAGLEDLAKLPFTTKADLRDTYPFGLFAVGMDDVVRLHASSGTTGKPIVVAYTHNDLEVWTSAIARSLACYGLHQGDVLQNAYGYGLFTGGLGLHYGAERLGLAVIPISGGNTDRQIMVMKDFFVTAVCCTPSYFLHLCDRAEELGVDLRRLPLRAGAFGAEPWSEAMRQRIEQTAGIKAFDIYGLTEILGPGVGAECCLQDGLHIFEDHFYPEVVDPQTLAPLPEGSEGELVITTLSKEAMPMIRYRTRDITAIIPEVCGCGRTLRRIRRVSRRTDDMLIIRGVNVFPSQIEAAILAVEGTLPHYQIVLSRQHDLDQLEVQVEVTAALFSDRIGALEELHARLERQLEQGLGVRAQVRLVEPHTIERSQGKAKRVIDNRTM